MKRIFLTEEQLELIQELTLNGDEALTNNGGNATQAAKETVTNAKKDGVNTDTAGTTVAFSNDSLKQNGIVGECITKRDIKAYRKQKLMENSVRFSKKELDKMLKK